MAATVFQLSLRVFALTIAIATLPTCADETQCNAVTTCRVGKQKLIVKTTVTPRPYNQSKTAAYSKYEMEVSNHIAIEPFNDEMETVTSESIIMAAGCNLEETANVDLGALLDAREGAMVTMVAGETRLVAHRAVLTARSPVFTAMLCHGTQDASSSQVAIPDVEGPVLRQLLAYLYTLQAPQLPGMAPQLLAAADKFDLSGLKAACEVQVAAQLAVETAAATAVLAIRHSSTSLRQAAIVFIKAHLVQVKATKGWADAVHYHPEDITEVFRLLTEPPAETSPRNASLCSTPAAADSQPTTGVQSQSHTGHGQTPATAAPPTPPRQTPPPDGDAVPPLQSLSAEEKGRRLIQVAQEGRLQEVEALLAAGADVGARERDRKTALHWAANGGHEELVRRLLGAGAEVDARNSVQWTPLHMAASNGRTAVVRLLLASSADPNARTASGLTPLHVAAWWDHAAVVRLLLAVSADVDSKKEDGGTPLHMAAYWGRAEVAAALLEAGANREARDKEGRTPLDIAKKEYKQRLIDMLT